MSHVGNTPAASYRIRLARAGDARAILAIYEDGFPEALRQFTALGSPRAQVYLKALLEEGLRGGATPFWVACRAEDEEAVIGFVQWRLVNSVAVLNNIYVRSQSRAARVGTMLLAESFKRLDWPFKNVELDVFENNDRARAWYERLGFAEYEQRAWYTSQSWCLRDVDRETSASRERGKYLIDGLPQADVVHAAFGFSQFRLTTTLGTYTIGRLGDAWFRLFASSLLEDRIALEALHRIDACRGLFLITCSDEKIDRPPNITLRKVAGSHRMQAPREVVALRLAGQTG